jgi:hypothetical protein
MHGSENWTQIFHLDFFHSSFFQPFAVCVGGCQYFEGILFEKLSLFIFSMCENPHAQLKISKKIPIRTIQKKSHLLHGNFFLYYWKCMCSYHYHVFWLTNEILKFSMFNMNLLLLVWKMILCSWLLMDSFFIRILGNVLFREIYWVWKFCNFYHG